MSKKTLDMTAGEPFKLIAVFAIPMLLGNIFQQLYNMFDTIIVGRLLGPDSLAAVGNTGPMNFLVLGFLYGMTSGFSVITAQRFGAQDMEGLKKSVAANIVLNLISGIIVTVIASSLALPILKLTHTPENILRESFSYILIIYLGSLAIVLYNGCSCILRAVGDSKTPLYFLIFASFLNIILDYVLIKYTNLKVAGAALATVIAQIVSGIASFIWIFIKYPILIVKPEHFKSSLNFYWKHLSIGFNMGFQFSITAIGVVILQGALNKFGSTHIAAYTAAQKVEQLVTVAAGVMGVTMSTYSGQNLGAGKISRIKEGVTKASIISIAFAVLSAVLAWLLGDEMIGLFLDKKSIEINEWKEILRLGNTYLHICSVFFPSLFVLFIYRNTLQGIGKGFWPLMGGVFELIARTIAAYTLPGVWGFAGICAAGPIAWISAALPLAISYSITIKKMTLQ